MSICNPFSGLQDRRIATYALGAWSRGAESNRQCLITKQVLCR